MDKRNRVVLDAHLRKITVHSISKQVDWKNPAVTSITLCLAMILILTHRQEVMSVVHWVHNNMKASNRYGYTQAIPKIEVDAAADHAGLTAC